VVLDSARAAQAGGADTTVGVPVTPVIRAAGKTLH
jgi:hypothetical protein